MKRPRKPHACRTCGATGHNSTNCPTKPLRVGKSKGAKAALWLRDNPDSTVRGAAERFGISHQAVQQQWARLNLGRTPYRSKMDELRERALEMARSGSTIIEIQTALGVNYATPYKWCLRAGVEIQSSIGIDEAEMQSAIALVQGGGSLAAGAKILGVSYGHFARLIRDRGVLVGPKAPASGHRNGLGKIGSDLMDAERLTLTAAAARIGVAPGSIRAYRVHRGLPLVLLVASLLLSACPGRSGPTQETCKASDAAGGEGRRCKPTDR